MDIVGDAIRALRIGTPRSARAYLYGSWSLRWDPSRGAGFTIHIVLQGDPWLRPEHGEPIALHAGDVVFVSRAIAHGVADSPHGPLVDVPVDEAAFWFGSTPDPAAAPGLPLTVLIGGSYYLDRARMHPLVESLPTVIVLPDRTGRDDPIRSIVDLLVAEHDDEEPGVSAAIPALLDLLLAYVVRAAFQTIDQRSGWAALARDRRMSAALLALQNRPEEPWTVESLARAAGMSRAVFARRFAELVGRPPLRYLTWWRMNLARTLLAETDLPIAAVGRRSGYGSEFAFGKAFRREVGRPPGDYRRAARADDRSTIARR